MKLCAKGGLESILLNLYLLNLIDSRAFPAGLLKFGAQLCYATLLPQEEVCICWRPLIRGFHPCPLSYVRVYNHQHHALTTSLVTPEFHKEKETESKKKGKFKPMKVLKLLGNKHDSKSKSLKEKS